MSSFLNCITKLKCQPQKNLVFSFSQAVNLTTNINELLGFSNETPDTILQFHEYFVLVFIIAKFYRFAFFRLKHPNIIELLGFFN